MSCLSVPYSLLVTATNKYLQTERQINVKTTLVFITETNEWAVYKSGMGTRGQGRGDTCVGTWGRKTRDLGTLSMGRGDAGMSKTGTQGTWDVNEYRKSRR